MSRFLSTVWAGFFALLCAGPLAAQDLPESVFRDYDHMREVLDGGMMERNIVDVMRAFGASDEMTIEELNDLQIRVRAIFPEPFVNVDVMRSEKMGEDWTLEMYAYHVGYAYVYAVVLFHQQPDALVAVKFKFNTDPFELTKDF